MYYKVSKYMNIFITAPLPESFTIGIIYCSNKYVPVNICSNKYVWSITKFNGASLQTVLT